MTEDATAAGTRTVILERVFPYPPEKLWRALTESPLLAQWLMPNDFEPVVGRKFQLRANPVPQWDGIIDSEVLVVEPLKQLAYTWRTLGLESVVLFKLTPAEAGTQLRLEHSGFPVDRDANYKGASYGWQRFFGSLDTLLAGGIA